MKLVSKGNPLFLCNVRDLNNKVKDIPEDIEVVNEFLDVFPEETPEMPPDRPIY